MFNKNIMKNQQETEIIEISSQELEEEEIESHDPDSDGEGGC